jgi:hypothetical protein
MNRDSRNRKSSGACASNSSANAITAGRMVFGMAIVVVGDRSFHFWGLDMVIRIPRYAGNSVSSDLGGKRLAGL